MKVHGGAVGRTRPPHPTAKANTPSPEVCPALWVGVNQLLAGGLFWTPQRPHPPVPLGLGPAWKIQRGPA